VTTALSYLATPWMLAGLLGLTAVLLPVGATRSDHAGLGLRLAGCAACLAATFMWAVHNPYWPVHAGSSGGPTHWMHTELAHLKVYVFGFGGIAAVLFGAVLLAHLIGAARCEPWFTNIPDAPPTGRTATPTLQNGGGPDA
jgi:hypothetical protein